MKEFHADSLLEVLEDNLEEKESEGTTAEARFVADFERLLRAGTRRVPVPGFIGSGRYDTSVSQEQLEWPDMLSRRERLAAWLQSTQYEMIIAMVLCFNVLWMAFELQLSGQVAGHELGIYGSRPVLDFNSVFLVGDVIFTTFFCLDVTIRIAIIRRPFFQIPMNYLDVAVSATSLVEIAVFYTMTLPVNPMLFRLLRIGKLVRAVRMVHMTSMHLGSHVTRCLP